MSRTQRDSQVLPVSSGRRVGLGVYGARDGFPILALHGTPASRYMFDVADETARAIGATLFCPERPGYGLSDPPLAPRASEAPRAPDALARHMDDLVEVVDALGLDRFSIVGISGGAPYGVALACRMGTRVSSLGLVSPMGPFAELPASLVARTTRGQRLLFQTLPRWPLVVRGGAILGAGLFGLAPHLFSKVVASTLGKSDQGILSDPDVLASLTGMMAESLRNGVSGALADLNVFSKPWNVDYKTLSAPAILWYGTDDRLVPIASSTWLGAQLPGCSIVKYDGFGHFWVYSRIEEVLETVVRLAGR